MVEVLHVFHVKPQRWVEVKDVNPAEDYNYVSFVYHQSNAPGETIDLEAKHWEPFIKASMDAGKTTQKAWGKRRDIYLPAEAISGQRTISFDL